MISIYTVNYVIYRINMKKISNLVTLCHPSVLFILFTLAILYYDYRVGKNWVFFTIYLGFACLWLLFLNWLCSTGHGIVSWFLVFLPFGLLMAYVIFISRKKNTVDMVDQVLEPVKWVSPAITYNDIYVKK